MNMPAGSNNELPLAQCQPEAEKETGKTLKNDLKAVEPELKELEEAVRMLALQVPNIPASDVPVGKDESGNQLVRQVGTPSQMEFEPEAMRK